MNEKIEKAVRILEQGGIIIFPTDTAFGIGCRIDDEEAIKRIFKIRQRPIFQATPVLVRDLEMARDYLETIPKEVIESLINPYWPGALTIVMNCKKNKVPSLVRGGGDTLGVRMPNHVMILSIIQRLGVPILGPSANIHAKDTPYEYEDIDPELIKLVDYVLVGECVLKKPSTVIDCSSGQWKILRKGALDINI